MRIDRLDGLRAIAVGAVILHHHELLRGGWVGVDLFFVLSGFMITGILRRDRDDEFYWRRFYMRRAARILPPMIALILGVAIYYHPPVRSLLVYIFFMGNFANLTRWGTSPQLGLLWSLAIEEHFYLFFPIAVRYLPRTGLLKMLLAVTVIEPVARLLATSHVQGYFPIYSWTFFRIDGLAMGAILALLAEQARAKAWLAQWSGPCAAAIALLFGALSYSLPLQFDRMSDTPFFNCLGYSLVGLTSMFAIAYILLHPAALISRILESRPFVFVGSISYGLYLYHISVMLAVMRATHLNIHQVLAFSVAAAIIVSLVSFRFLEKPIMAWGHSFLPNPRNVTSPAAEAAESVADQPLVHNLGR